MTTSERQPCRRRRPESRFRRKLKLAFASIGVVFGDIGTSPLYAMREALAHVVDDPTANLRDRRAGRRLAADLGADPHRHDQIRASS